MKVPLLQLIKLKSYITGSSSNMRVFIAVEFSEETLNYFESLQEELKKEIRGRSMSRNNLHMTLAFLGDVEFDKIQELIKAFKKITFPPISLTTKSLNTFGEGTLVVSFFDEPILTEYRNRIVQLLSDLSIKYDEKRFVPHLTLFRKSNKKIYREITPYCAIIKNVHIFSSVLTSDGAIYDIIG